MPSNFYLQLDGLVVVLGVALALAASYRSLLARRILRRPVYRSHALWTTLIGLVFGVTFVLGAYDELTAVELFGGLPTTSVPYIVGILGIVLWAWIDQSIEVALDMDFLHRDTIFWKAGVRFVAWAFILAGFVFYVFLVGTVFYDGFTVLIVYAAVVLFISAKKVRDAAMKSYVKWVGVMAVSIVIMSFTYPYLSPFLLFAYALYRASGSFTKTTPLEAPSPQK
jgi:hypothetical protein